MGMYPIDRSKNVPIEPSKHGLEVGARADEALAHVAREAGDATPDVSGAAFTSRDLIALGVILALTLAVGTLTATTLVAPETR